MASLGNYTNDEDTTKLQNIFQNKLDKLETMPPVEPGAPVEELQEYFASVLPEYDRDRVSTGDIKKVIKWFGFLHSHNLLQPVEKGGEEE